MARPRVPLPAAPGRPETAGQYADRSWAVDDYRTDCPVDGCAWWATYPLAAKPGADLRLAEHLAAEHVEVYVLAEAR